MVALDFLYVWYIIFLSCKLTTSFFLLYWLSLFKQNDKLLRSSCKFLGYWTSTSRKYSSYLFNCNFYETELSLTHVNPFTRNFYNIAQPHKFFTFQYLRGEDSLALP